MNNAINNNNAFTNTTKAYKKIYQIFTFEKTVCKCSFLFAKLSK